MPKSNVKKMRVFVVESPSALDMLADRTESQTLQAICKLLGHDFASLTVRSAEEFQTAIDHITSINPELLRGEARKRPLCVHIAAHGDCNGLSFGPDSLCWRKIATKLWKFFGEMKDYLGPIILVVSACGAEKQTITQHLKQDARKHVKIKPPAYVLTTVSNLDGGVYWHDAVVAWSILYHQIGAAVLADREDIQAIVERISLVGAGMLKYFRWDESKRQYVSFASKLRQHKGSKDRDS